MAVTAVAVGEADPAWATSPTDTADPARHRGGRGRRRRRRIWNSTSASTGHTMGWITNGVNYQVQVRALNAAGTGPASQTAATPTAARPPGP